LIIIINNSIIYYTMRVFWDNIPRIGVRFRDKLNSNPSNKNKTFSKYKRRIKALDKKRTKMEFSLIWFSPNKKKK
jgi:hypothetical protein